MTLAQKYVNAEISFILLYALKFLYLMLKRLSVADVSNVPLFVSSRSPSSYLENGPEKVDRTQATRIIIYNINIGITCLNYIFPSKLHRNIYVVYIEKMFHKKMFHNKYGEV